MKITNWKIGHRLVLGFGFVAGCTTIVGIVGIFQMSKLADLNTQMYNHPMAVSNALRDIRSDINAMHRSMKDVVLAETENRLSIAISCVNTLEQKVFKSFDIIRERFLGNEKNINVAQKVFSDWKSIRQEVIDLKRRNEITKAADITRGKGSTHVIYMDETIKEMSEFAQIKADQFYKEVQDLNKRYITAMIGFILFVFLVSIGLGVLITKSVTIPIAQFMDWVEMFGKGDLNHKLSIDQKDEIGLLASSFNKMGEDLQKTTASIDDLNKEIADRKQTEKKLRDSELLFKTIGKTVPYGIWITDAKGYCLFTSPSFLEMVDMTLEQVQEFGWLHLLPPEDVEPTKEHWLHCVNTGDDFEREHRVRSKDGSYRNVLAIGRPIKGDQGMILKWVGLNLDVTERKITKEELLLQGEIMRHMAEGVHLVRMDGIIVFANPKFESMFGYDPGEIIGKQVSVLNYPTNKSPEEMAQEIMKKLDDDGMWQGEIKNIRKDGAPFWCYVSVISFDHSKHGKVLVAVHNDITSRKKTEEELQKAHDQLLHAEKLSAVGNLSASIAHEFNNPLAGVTSVIRGIKKRGVFDKDDAELIDMAIQECRRMKDLIWSLQSFSRPSSGTIAFFNIHEHIDSLLLMSKKNFQLKQISVEKFYAPNLPHVKAVADQIKQVVLNLLANSTDACEQGGLITIRTEKENDNVIIRVKDNGAGIKEEEIDHIFEPFFSTKPEVKGNGLGLSVSYGIVKEHGGTIVVESEEGKGSVFSVILPISGVTDA